MAVTKKGASWEFRKSLWIIWSFFFLVNGIGMYIAGKKVKVKKWYNYGLLYTALSWIVLIAGSEVSKESILQDIFYAIFFISYIACIVHCLRIRKEYLIRLEVLEDKKTEEIEMNTLRSKIQMEYGVEPKIENTYEVEIKNEVKTSNEVYTAAAPEYTPKNEKVNIYVNENIKANEYKNEMPEVPNKEPRISNYETEVSKSEANRVIDINSCSEAELTELPGMGLILAKKAINLRNSKNGFSSVDDFIQELGIKPHFVDKLREGICCNPVENIEVTKTSGRRVDF